MIILAPLVGHFEASSELAQLKRKCSVCCGNEDASSSSYLAFHKPHRCSAARLPPPKKRPLGFASPPHDGFAFLAAPSRRRCAYIPLSMTEKNRDVKDCSVASELDNPYSLNCRQKVASRKPP